MKEGKGYTEIAPELLFWTATHPAKTRTVKLLMSIEIN